MREAASPVSNIEYLARAAWFEEGDGLAEDADRAIDLLRWKDAGYGPEEAAWLNYEFGTPQTMEKLVYAACLCRRAWTVISTDVEHRTLMDALAIDEKCTVECACGT